MERNTKEAIIIGFIMFILAGLICNAWIGYEDNKKNTALYMDLKQTTLQIKSDLNQVFTNQKALEANQLGVKRLADETNVNQQLAERFFDNIVMEIILNNNLKTTGEAYKKHQEDLNALRELGYFGGD